MAAIGCKADLDVLFEGLMRLQLDPEDSLSDLSLTAGEVDCLIAASKRVNNGDPSTLSEALSSENKEEWRAAAIEELDSLFENCTFDLNSASLENKRRKMPGSKALTAKWVLKRKINADQSIRFKARLVIRGFLQRYGINFDETYAPVATHTTFRLLMALTAARGWPVHQMDVVTAFLNPVVDSENIWVELPEGCEDHCKKHGVGKTVRLLKGLYGLKQASRLWWLSIDKTLQEFGLKRCNYDTNVYVGDGLIVLLYVDDIIIFGTDSANPMTKIDSLKACLSSTYKMHDLGTVQKYLGYEIEFHKGGIHISQKAYAERIIRRFDMQNCANAKTPMDERLSLLNGCVPDKALSEKRKTEYQSIVEALLYLALGSRPDICFAISSLSRHCSRPLESHLTAVRRVLRYVKSTMSARLSYPNDGVLKLSGFSDANWASTEDDRRSVGGYNYFLGNALITWRAKRQPIVALSTVEAELIACSEATREAVWLRNLAIELIGPLEPMATLVKEPVTIACDNQGTIAMITGGHINVSSRTKHIDIRFYHAREMHMTKAVCFKYVNTTLNVADILTKPLGKDSHYKLAGYMGLQFDEVGDEGTVALAATDKGHKTAFVYPTGVTGWLKPSEL